MIAQPRKLWLVRLAVLAAILVPSASALSSAAATPATVYDLMTDAVYETVNGATVVAQSFTTSSAPGTLTSVKLWLRNESGGTGSYTVRLMSTSSTTGKPDATLATIATSGSEVAYWDGQPVLSSSQALLADTQYFVVVSGTGGMLWKGGTSAPASSVSPVPAFPSYKSTDSGSSWNSISGTYRDMVVVVDEQPIAPAAPVLNSLTQGDGSLTVSATLGSTGGSAVTSVEYRLNGGTWTASGGTSGSFTISGLTNGTAYAVEVRAVNAVGNGAASNSLSATPRTNPDPPTAVTANAGDGSAAVSWSAPVDDGGSTITSYTVTASPGGAVCSSSATTCTVSGLSNGTTYTFTVVATNAIGSSAASSASAATTPRASGGGGGGGGGSPTPTPTPEASPSPTASAEPTLEPTSEPVGEASPVVSPRPITPPKATSSPSPTRAPVSSVPSATTASPSGSPSGSPSPSAGETIVEEEELVLEPSATPRPSMSASGADDSQVSTPGALPTATFDARPPPGQSLLTDNALIGPVLQMRVDVQVGSSIVGRSAIVEAAGLQPGSDVVIQLFSEPQVIGSGKVDTAGNAAIATVIPAGLPAGQHTIMATVVGPDGVPVQSIGAFEITDDSVVTAFAPPGQVSTPLDPDDPQLARALAAGKPVYDVSQYPAVIATVAVAGAALLGLAGIGGLARVSTAGAASSSGSSRSARGKLAGVVTKKLKALGADDEGWGDRSRTWAMPGTAHTDAWIKALSIRAGRFSALVPRVLVDGAWARAMFGSFGFVLWGAGLMLGLVSAWSTGFQALPPQLPVILAIIALGILDAAAGAVAWLTITIAALLTGHITTWADFRTVLGLFVLFATIPLLAHVIRPLRRRVNGTAMSVFDRVADYVMPTVFLAFAAASMFKALNGLSGLELVSSDDFGEIRVVVVLAFLLRMAMEDVATYGYPARSAEVQPTKLTSPGRPLALLSVAVRVVLFLVIAEPFFGLGWATYLSALLIAVPLVLKVYEDDLPNLPWLNKWYPRGVANFAMLLVIGIYVSFWLLGQDASDDQVRQTYNLILLPGIVSGLIQLVGREGGTWPENWWKRLLGLVVWLFAVGIVTGMIALA